MANLKFKILGDHLNYNPYTHYMVLGIIGTIIFLFLLLSFVLFQIFHRPWPTFTAVDPNGQHMEILAYEEPNLLPDTILRWSSKAAVTAYNFDFGNYNKQIQAVRPYFTDTGWEDYQNSVVALLKTIVSAQLIVSGVVAGTPVISNQGLLPGKGYTWRIQIPFLVTYQAATVTTKRKFMVELMLVRVPTNVNPQGIGIDQFVMR